MKKLIEYKSDSELIAFCALWINENRSPWFLKDWLLDRDFYPQAEFLDWVHNTPSSNTHYGYVRPFRTSGSCMWIESEYDQRIWPSRIPTIVFKHLVYYDISKQHKNMRAYSTGVIACIDLLDTSLHFNYHELLATISR